MKTPMPPVPEPNFPVASVSNLIRNEISVKSEGAGEELPSFLGGFERNGKRM
jgi:hypothetical protein